MARFFIDRPVFAWVISILIMGVGVLAIRLLPVAQYPQIAPPSVTITGWTGCAISRRSRRRRDAPR